MCELVGHLDRDCYGLFGIIVGCLDEYCGHNCVISQSFGHKLIWIVLYHSQQFRWRLWI
jgi:hypothetical protein